MERPMSVEQIVGRAGSSDFDPQYTLQQWFRTGQVILKQASIYEHEGNDQDAYLLLFRYSRLILEDLPKHPQSKDIQFRPAWQEARQALRRSLAKLEVLKPKINRRYEVYQKKRQARQAQTSAKTTGSPKSFQTEISTVEAGQTAVYGQEMEKDGPSTPSRNISRIDPAEHRDLAVKLANKEVRRRMEGATVFRHDDQGDHSLSSNLIDARRQLDRSERGISGNRTRQAREQSNLISVNYPVMPGKGKDFSDEAPLRLSHPTPLRPPKILAPPMRLSQNGEFGALHQDYSSPSPPPLPNKLSLDLSPPSPSRSLSVTPPTPTEQQFTHASTLENGQPLRTVFLPRPLRHRFTHIAQQNTAHNLETCGVLCGTLIRNALFITKLVIPEQHSTSDTCEMLDEAALWAYCDAQPEELMTLGWIHTHPTQTCFMSSRDLHTHMGYQLGLAEAIAIVCAPSKDPDWGIFRLTDPPGMQAIRKCSQPGLFHPHAETHIFTDVLGRPGHVIEHEGLEFEVVDLRPKSRG